jgi:hypothetical protein
MASAKKTLKSNRKKVNKSQPSYILKQKQKTRVRALLAEKRRQDELRRQFEEFIKEFRVPGNNDFHVD